MKFLWKIQRCTFATVSRDYDRRLAINIETFATITGLIQDKVNRAFVHTCSDRTVTGSSIVQHRRGLRNMRHPSSDNYVSSEMRTPANSDDDCQRLFIKVCLQNCHDCWRNSPPNRMPIWIVFWWKTIESKRCKVKVHRRNYREINTLAQDRCKWRLS